MIDPVSMATQLASWEVYSFENRANMQLQALSAKRSALSSINSELSGFNSFVKNLNSYTNSVIKNSASSSDEDFLSATAKSNAQAGSYQIFVEQLAQNHQLATQLPAGTTQDSLVPASGTITLDLNGEEFVVDLADAVNADGELNYAELVKTINADPENVGINASLVRTNGDIQLLFTSEESGEANEIVISSATGDTDFDALMASNSMTELVKNQDAIAWLGAESSGIRLQSDSNELSNVIDGVDLTLKKTQASGETPMTLTVGSDSEETNAVMNEFVEKYNSIINEINKYSNSGGESQARGILASDATARGITSSLRSVMQQSFNGVTTAEMGFEFDRDGKLKFDSDKFEEFQKSSTVDIDDMFRGEGMLLDQMQGKLDIYSHSSTGSLKSQMDVIDMQKSRADDKLEALDRKYEMHYSRYLKQFTALNSLQMQMNNVSSLF